MKPSSKPHKWLRLSGLAGLLALTPLVFSDGPNGEDLVQFNEATCATCCPETFSICAYGPGPTDFLYDHYYKVVGSCNGS